MKKQTITVLCFTMLLVCKSFGQWGNGTMNTLTQTTNGNVGIGTPTPISKLTIWDNVTASDDSRMIRLGYAANYDYRIFRQGSNGFLRFDGTQNTYSGFMFTTPQAPNGLTILNAGNVGIGTATPAKKLTVNGDASFISNPGINSFEILGNNQVPVRRGISLDNDPSGKFNFYIHGWQTNASFNFMDGATNKNLVSIAANGQTRIGNKIVSTGNNTDALLSVYGKIVSTSVYVTTQNWADFVFDKNYKLPKLSEIESFYQEYKHLPNIPSEKEILEKGIDLGEMNKLLLQKIEELTILLVEQDKRIKKIESKN